MNIREDRANVIPAFQNTDGFIGIRCRDSFEPGLLHHVQRAQANEVFILHHKHDRLSTGNRVAHF